MGNNSSNQYEQINKTDYTFTYQLIRKVNDRHYGEIKVVRDIKTGEQMYLKEIPLTTKETYQEELNFYNKRISVSHPNVVKIYGCNGQDAQNFCSSYFKISVFIEMLSKTLTEELENRIESDVPFSENDILLIADNLISGLSYFQTQGVAHGDIRLDNIFIGNRCYKLSDPNLAVMKDSNALSNAILGQAKTFLAPELLPQIGTQDFVIKCNKFKADVFSLGVTLLSLTSLTYSQELYDYEAGDLYLDLLEERLEIVRRTYSKFTYDLIRDMLREDKSRPDFIALENRLMPYREDIRNKEELPFFGIRAPFDEGKSEEEENDISRYTYTEKANPILQDFIQSQMAQSTTRKRQPNHGDGDEFFDHSEDFAGQTPYGNEYDQGNDFSDEYDRPMGNSEQFEDAQEYPNDLPHHIQEQAHDYHFNSHAKQYAGVQETPIRSVNKHEPEFQNPNPPQFEFPNYIGSKSSIPQAKTQNPPQFPEHLYKTPQQQPQPQEAFREAYLGDIQYERQKNPSFHPSAQPHFEEPQVRPPVKQQTVTQQTQQTPHYPQSQGKQFEGYPIMSAIGTQQQQYQPQPQPQAQAQPQMQAQTQVQPQIQRQEENPPAAGSDKNLDDLEAKIKAALERSEATYRKAYKSSQDSPTKIEVPKYGENTINQYQSQSQSQPLITYLNYNKVVPGGNALREVPFEEKNNVDSLNTPASLKPLEKYNITSVNQSDIYTKASSNENTFYDLTPGLTQKYSVDPSPQYNSYQSNYVSNTYQEYKPEVGYTSQVNGTSTAQYGLTSQNLYGGNLYNTESLSHYALSGITSQDTPKF